MKGPVKTITKFIINMFFFFFLNEQRKFDNPEGTTMKAFQLKLKNWVVS